jgi:type IV fimbrial biogenesis protein FimT
MKARNNIWGFSLIELMITVALIAILLLAATPSIQVYLENRKIRNVAESIVAGMQKARTHAVINGRPTEFALNTGTGAWVINDFDATRIPQWQTVELFVFGPGGHNWTSIQINNVFLTDLTVSTTPRITFNSIGRVMPNNLRAPIPPLQRLDVARTTAMADVLLLRVEANAARGIRVCAPHLDGTGDSRACNP